MVSDIEEIHNSLSDSMKIMQSINFLENPSTKDQISNKSQ